MTILYLLLFACNDDPAQSKDTAANDNPVSWMPDFYCPGSEGCTNTDGSLYVGIGAKSITPTCFESWRDCGEDGICEGEEGYTEPDSGEMDGEWDRNTEPFLDCGCDQLCPEDEGYSAPDEGEGDGDFQAIWLAGFHNGRPVKGVHDDLWARTIVFEKGDTRIGLMVLDVIGFFYDDVQRVRQIVKDKGVDIDYLIISSTHNHESPDTLGLWGRTATSGGYDENYVAELREQAAESVVAAVDDLEEVGRIKVGAVDVGSYFPEKGTSNLIRDSRDPKVIDEMLTAALFENTNGETIATLSHFGNHPESMADENTMITSDFPDKLRVGLEEGVNWESHSKEGYGGASIYVQGTVGGLMTPLGITITDFDGNDYREYTFERNDVFGYMMADHAMDAIENGDEITGTSISDLDISVAKIDFKMPVENYGFQAMFITEILNRKVVDYDPDEIIDEDNMPYVNTEMALLTVGPLGFLTVPGELVPELAIGGYDGSHVGDPTKTLIDEDNPNPPDISLAPEGPYLKEQITETYSMIVGLGNDMVGYIVPEYNFQLHPNIPWFDEAEGDHYEETNSLGPQTATIVRENGEKLLNWKKEQ